ncbi:MAG: DUF362 domain-containing protein [Planctomycetota bacterium]
MEDQQKRADIKEPSDSLKISEFMMDPEAAGPVIHLQPGDANLSAPDEHTSEVNAALRRALSECQPGPTGSQALIKVHIGERKCETRMKPDYAPGASEFLQERGSQSVVAGDTTVAYTGPRGHEENPEDDSSAYLQLAAEHGWTADGPAGIPFVVLDRPETCRDRGFAFEQPYQRTLVDNAGLFDDFHPAGGFLAADSVVNFAHLTLHGLAGVAGCMKSIAMGCAALPGKLRMHQSLLPEFDPARCERCGLCVAHCPVEALTLPDEADVPRVNPDLCIGCGECEAVCAPRNDAVTLEGKEIEDWTRGQNTLPVRMSDYVIGLMNGRWDDVVHVLHMYSITERCDCLNTQQEPMITKDPGFLIGRNPFAVDRTGAAILRKELEREGYDPGEELLETADRAAEHVRNTYGIVSDLPVKEISL